MAIEYLDHFTIRCADMERTRTFYCDVLGLENGPRPAVSIPGYWLYCGGIPQVHLVNTCDPHDGARAPAANGAFDHVAFRLSDPEAMIARLKTGAIPYEERTFPDLGLRQIVVHDPEGILVELNCSAARSRPEPGT